MHAANPRALQRHGNAGLQPAVGGQADNIVDPRSLGPRKHRLAAKTGIGTQDDVHIRPVRPDPLDQPVKFRHNAGRHIPGGTAEQRQHRHAFAEHQEWHSAILLVIAMEELLFLVAVQRHIGGIKVENDLLRWHLVTLDEKLHHELGHGFEVGDNLAVFALRPPRRRQLEAVQGALARQWRAVSAAGLELAESGAEGLVVAPSVVIIEILVTQSQSKDTLADQCRNIMHHQMLGARVLETLGQPIRHAGDAVGLALQKNPGVGGDRTPGKVGFYAASVASGHLTCELGCITDCIHGGNVLSYFNNWN